MTLWNPYYNENVAYDSKSMSKSRKWGCNERKNALKSLLEGGIAIHSTSSIYY